MELFCFGGKHFRFLKYLALRWLTTVFSSFHLVYFGRSILPPTIYYHTFHTLSCNNNGIRKNAKLLLVKRMSSSFLDIRLPYVATEKPVNKKSYYNSKTRWVIFIFCRRIVASLLNYNLLQSSKKIMWRMFRDILF